MSNGRQQTGISDSVYNLASVLFHAAKGGQLYAKHVQDAEQQRATTSSPTSSGRYSSRTPSAQQAKSLLNQW